MQAHLRTYGQLARAGFRRQATYRMALLAGLVTNIVLGFIRAAILFAAVDSAGGTLAGYTRYTVSALTDLPDSEHLGSEGSGMRQRLAFDAEKTTAATLLAEVAKRAEVRDLSIEEPDIEDVVRRIYQSTR